MRVTHPALHTSHAWRAVELHCNANEVHAVPLAATAAHLCARGSATAPLRQASRATAHLPALHALRRWSDALLVARAHEVPLAHEARATPRVGQPRAAACPALGHALHRRSAALDEQLRRAVDLHCSADGVATSLSRHRAIALASIATLTRSQAGRGRTARNAPR